MDTQPRDRHQQTGEIVKLVREGNQAAMRRAERREETIHQASRRSTRVVNSALARLRASGVIR
jgi:hypothetical protein